jgi:hypothetical protein
LRNFGWIGANHHGKCRRVVGHFGNEKTIVVGRSVGDVFAFGRRSGEARRGDLDARDAARKARQGVGHGGSFAEAKARENAVRAFQNDEAQTGRQAKTAGGESGAKQ